VKKEAPEGPVNDGGGSIKENARLRPCLRAVVALEREVVLAGGLDPDQALRQNDGVPAADTTTTPAQRQ
jgi:hypothetical protein